MRPGTSHSNPILLKDYSMLPSRSFLENNIELREVSVTTFYSDSSVSEVSEESELKSINA